VASDKSRFVRSPRSLSSGDFSGASFSLILLVIGVERRARARELNLSDPDTDPLRQGRKRVREDTKLL